MKNKINHKLLIWIIGLSMLTYIVMIAMGFYSTEFDKKPVVQDKIKDNDIGYLYDFYVSGTPDINERPFIGKKDAAITLVAYMDNQGESSRYFINEIFPTLKTEYMDEGKVRFYYKPFIIADDISKKTDRFIYAMSLDCIIEINPEAYFSYASELFKATSKKDIIDIASKNGLNVTELQECMAADPNRFLLEDLSEINNFGLTGITPVFYVGIEDTNTKILDGVPSIDKFRKTIKQLEFAIGT